MDKEEQCDNLIRLLKDSGGHAYWCKYCGRHIQPDPVALKEGNLLYIHDDVHHPDNFQESGDEHRLH